MPSPPRTLSAHLSCPQTAAVKQAIHSAGDAVKARHPWLRWQNAIGFSLMLLSLAGMGLSGWLWYRGWLSAWISIPLSAFFASIIHELEHDLIHYLYFRHKPLLHHLMLALCWLSRPLTINPWIRRRLHFHHHKHSGSETDIEERAITNGEVWGPLRLLMMFDGMISILVRMVRHPGRRLSIALRGAAAYFPLGLAAWGTWYAFELFHGISGFYQILGERQPWSADTLQLMHGVDILTVVVLAPNLLRSFCINLVSSNMHYYGDIEDGNIIQQTQVLKPWWLLPAQCFCFNFGATHAIHHFVVGQPFYLRQWIASSVYPAMRAAGVRFNDVGTFGRANRWGGEGESASVV